MKTDNLCDVCERPKKDMQKPALVTALFQLVNGAEHEECCMKCWLELHRWIEEEWPLANRLSDEPAADIRQRKFDLAVHERYLSMKAEFMKQIEIRDARIAELEAQVGEARTVSTT